MEGGVRLAFRHFPLTRIHPHALAASAAAEAAALQDRFWVMHELFFHRQKVLDEDDMRRYGAGLELDIARFDHDLEGADSCAGFAGTWRVDFACCPNELDCSGSSFAKLST